MQHRSWEWGRYYFDKLPLWLRIILTPLYYWLDILAARPRMVLSIGLVLGGFLVLQKMTNGNQENLSWLTVLLLATGHIWITLFIILSFYPVYLPVVFMVWLLVGFKEVPVEDDENQTTAETSNERDENEWDNESETYEDQ